MQEVEQIIDFLKTERRSQWIKGDLLEIYVRHAWKFSPF